MLARKEMPEHFLAWNRAWGAPTGHDRWWRRAALRVSPEQLRPRIVGPFGFQPDNSETRRYEYPWAFHATPLPRGTTAVDLGASLSGLQFALAKAGVAVLNVDPGESAVMGWPLDGSTFAALNRAFGTSVELRPCFIENAGIRSDSVDRVFCISTLEHVPDGAIESLLAEIRRILRPGGRCVLTVDLFFDLAPFTDKLTNDSGRNVDIAWLVSTSGLELVQGVTSELCGFPDFRPRDILAGLSRFLYSVRVPALAQTLVLQKPGSQFATATR